MTAYESEVKCVPRLVRAAEIPRATLHRWVNGHSTPKGLPKGRPRPIADDPALLEKVRELCERPRNQTYGHRRIRALLAREFGLQVNRKTLAGIMRRLRYAQKRLRYKPSRPKHLERMRPDGPNKAWQIDMTSFTLADLRPLFLIVVIDCFTRKIVGWTLHPRCRAKEWGSALRRALDEQGLADRQMRSQLVLRSDNGAQPCSKHFVELCSQLGVRTQYTGYNAPDDNAFIERGIRTIKEEEVWLNCYDNWHDAHQAIDAYVQYYNSERIHSALDYRTPNEVEATCFPLKHP